MIADWFSNCLVINQSTEQIDPWLMFSIVEMFSPIKPHCCCSAQIWMWLYVCSVKQTVDKLQLPCLCLQCRLKIISPNSPTNFQLKSYCKVYYSYSSILWTFLYFIICLDVPTRPEFSSTWPAAVFFSSVLFCLWPRPVIQYYIV